MSEIDPVAFGRMQARIDALESEVRAARTDIKELLELANKGKGGFWMGMTMASVAGGFVTWLAGLWLHH